jgi:hypothetical protein
MHVQKTQDILVFVVNSLGFRIGRPKQMIIGLFEAIKTTYQTLAINLTKLLNQYQLSKNIIAYVKDEGSNSNAMTKF